jgi:hypothetical protein
VIVHVRVIVAVAENVGVMVCVSVDDGVAESVSVAVAVPVSAAVKVGVPEGVEVNVRVCDAETEATRTVFVEVGVTQVPGSAGFFLEQEMAIAMRITDVITNTMVFFI